MDPNANLAEQLRLAATLVEDPEASADSTRLAELVLALDNWIRPGPEGKDGFPPDRWCSEANEMRIVRDELIKYRDQCLSAAHLDATGALVLSQAIAYLSARLEARPFVIDPN